MINEIDHSQEIIIDEDYNTIKVSNFLSRGENKYCYFLSSKTVLFFVEIKCEKNSESIEKITINKIA